jgi:predicted class III extradiol MEMO1 family dioxygenase
MDIIDKFALLRERINQPKHQKVDICFNASTDFLHYLKDNEDIIQKLVNTEKIEYIDKEKDLQKYETENIIDVIIGIKAISKPIKEE